MRGLRSLHSPVVVLGSVAVLTLTSTTHRAPTGVRSVIQGDWHEVPDTLLLVAASLLGLSVVASHSDTHHCASVEEVADHRCSEHEVHCVGVVEDDWTP